MFRSLHSYKTTVYLITRAVVWVGFICKEKGCELLISASSSEVRGQDMKGAAYSTRD